MDLKLRKWAELYGEDLCIRAYSLYKNEDENPKTILQQLLSSEQLSKIKSNKINAHANGIIEAGKCLVGKMTLSASSEWWGGKNSRFVGFTGEGNTCEPKDLELYIKVFKERKAKAIEKEILSLQKKLEAIKKW